MVLVLSVSVASKLANARWSDLELASTNFANRLSAPNAGGAATDKTKK